MLASRQGMFYDGPGYQWFDSATVSTPQVVSFTVPSGVYVLTARLRGPGGRGGGVNTRAGGGGAGGAYVKASIPVTPFEVLTLTIGQEGGVTKIERGATVLVQCNGGASGNSDGGTVAGGTYSTHASVTVLQSANGGAGIGASDSCNPQPGGEGGGGGGVGYCGQPGGDGGSGGQFGRGGNACSINSWGTPGVSGTDSPGYPGTVNGAAYYIGGYGAPGLMKLEW